MNKTECPKSKLPLLIGDQLAAHEEDHVMAHVESCTTCQTELESMSASSEWWERARRSLSDEQIDDQCRLLAPDETVCSIDTILDLGQGRQCDGTSRILSALEPTAQQETLGQIDEFEVEQKIGQGGNGIVFRGFDRSLNRPVAIKFMAPHLADSGVARQRFEREARAAAAVVHPNVVPIYRVSSTQDGHPYIAMALADGLSLQDYVARNGPLDVKDVLRISIQIAGGLAEAHKQGLVHRDVKPANVLMEKKDVSRVMITDFGLARAADDAMMTQSGCLAGTPHYMSPEQVSGVELDHRSDLFSLGSLMYFIATGREPFRAESAFAVIHKIMRDVPKTAYSINVDIPRPLSRIIDRLLEKQPDHRIGSAKELEDLLTQVLAHIQEPSQHNSPRVRATTTERRKLFRRAGMLVALGGALLAGGLALAGVFDSSASNSGDGQRNGIQKDGSDEHGSESHSNQATQHHSDGDGTQDAGDHSLDHD